MDRCACAKLARINRKKQFEHPLIERLPLVIRLLGMLAVRATGAALPGLHWSDKRVVRPSSIRLARRGPVSVLRQPAIRRLRYHKSAYEFVFKALHFTQGALQKSSDVEDEAHVTGGELLMGVRDYARQQYGRLARIVLEHWGVRRTEDIGRIVFELVDRGEMRKTDRDTISDFNDVYDFATVFEREYEIDVRAFVNAEASST
jgi:uncharacterized repeat protein (TIGR04138 family)